MSYVTLDGGSITVEDGGQLWHRTDDLVVTMKKNIVGYGDANNQNNYYLLAFPFNENLPVPAEMTAPGCDLYMFNENEPNEEWRNNRDTPINELQAIYGYLFASPDDLELSLTGSTVLSGSYSYRVTYSEDPNNISNGWRLFGNILTCDVYIYGRDDDGEYTPMDVMVYNEEGEKVTLSAGPIPPMSAFFVKLTKTTDIIFSYYPRSNVRPAGALKGKFTVNSNGDKATCNTSVVPAHHTGSLPTNSGRHWATMDKAVRTKMSTATSLAGARAATTMAPFVTNLGARAKQTATTLPMATVTGTSITRQARPTGVTTQYVTAATKKTADGAH